MVDHVDFPEKPLRYPSCMLTRHIPRVLPLMNHFVLNGIDADVPAALAVEIFVPIRRR